MTKLVHILIFIPISCYSQINWFEMNNQFQQSLNSSVQARENERYRLDRIVDDAKQNIMNQNIISDVSGLINIFNDAQMVAMEDVDKFHRLLKNGMLSHRSFEPTINSVQQSVNNLKKILSAIDRRVSRKSTVMSNIEFDNLLSKLNGYIYQFKVDSENSVSGNRRYVISNYRIKIGVMETYEFSRSINSKYGL